MIQDNARENIQIENLKLVNGEEQDQKRHEVDAFFVPTGKCRKTYNKYPIELKTTAANGVGTNRDFGPDHIYKLSNRYFIASVGKVEKQTNEFIFLETYFLAQKHLKPWLDQQVERFIKKYERRDRLANAWYFMKENNPDRICAEDIKEGLYQINRGITLNTPKVPVKYLQKHGIRIQDKNGWDYSKLHSLFNQYPLKKVPNPLSDYIEINPTHTLHNTFGDLFTY